MNLYKHCYLEYQGHKYYDVDLLTEGTIYGEYTCIVDSNVRGKLENIKELTDNSIHPQKGSEIFSVPNSIYAANDLRKYYKLRRGVDSGDYNVFSPQKSMRNSGRFYYKSMCIVANENLIIVSREEISTAYFLTIAQDHLKKTISLYDCHFISADRFYFLNVLCIHPAYKMLLDGTLTKPAVLANNLDMNSDMELNIDVLRLVYHTGMKSAFDEGAEKNFLLQLNALNQYNWRKYPGTMSLLYCMIAYFGSGIAANIERNIKSQSKPIQEIYRCQNEDFADEKDFMLAQSLVNELMKIGDNHFYQYMDWVNIRMKIGVSERYFHKLFQTDVRVRPKKYENVNKED